MDIKEKRLAKGYSLRQLAYASGVSVDTILRIENGKVTPKQETMKYIEEALNG